MAGPIVAGMIDQALHDHKPLSIVRVGDGEGKALGMTKADRPPVAREAFSAKFVSQNGLPIADDAAIDFCRDVKQAATNADIIGFRSFQVDNEGRKIVKAIERGSYHAALGFYTPESCFKMVLMSDYGMTSR